MCTTPADEQAAASSGDESEQTVVDATTLFPQKWRRAASLSSALLDVLG